MKTYLILATMAVLAAGTSSCSKREHGIPNDGGASYQDHRTKPDGPPMDGSKEKLLPKGAE